MEHFANTVLSPVFLSAAPAALPRFALRMAYAKQGTRDRENVWWSCFRDIPGRYVDATASPNHRDARNNGGLSLRFEECIPDSSYEKARKKFLAFMYLAPGAGLEPATWWLTATRSTN